MAGAHPQQPTTEEVLARFESAFSRHPTLVVNYRVAATLIGKDAENQAAIRLRTEGVTARPHPLSGVMTYDSTIGFMLMNRSGWTRSEERQLHLGVHSPIRYELWTDGETAEFFANQSLEEARLDTIEVDDGAARLKAHERGQMSFGLLQGLKSYPHLARWAASGLRAGGDVTGAAADEDSITLSSQVAGIAATVHSETGQFEALRYTLKRGEVWDWEFREFSERSWFPACYPGVVLKSSTRSGGQPEHEAMVLIESVTEASEPAQDKFSWKSVAPFAHDRTRGVVINRAGAIDAERTKAKPGMGNRRQVEVAVATPDSTVEPAQAWGWKHRVGVIVAGVVACAAGIAFMIRGRRINSR